MSESEYSKARFPKVGPVLGEYIHSLKLTLDVLELRVKSKTNQKLNVLSVLNGSFKETCLRGLYCFSISLKAPLKKPWKTII